jgi:tripartite-type tricarboxylate transporter receptor subunit TctC
MKRFLLSILLIALANAPAHAQDFYKGKQISIVVGNAAGGGYDAYARLLQRHMGRFIPGNPEIVVRNMPGAGGMQMANWLYNDAPKDGTAIGLSSRNSPLEPVLGNTAARFRTEKFNWIGTPTSYEDDAYLLVVRADSRFKTIEDAQGPGDPIIFGAFANGGSDTDLVLVAREVLQLNLKLIRGYNGTPAVGLAMERGEVDGRAIGMSSLLAAYGDATRNNKFRYLAQFGHEKRWSRLPDVPTARELVKDPNDLAILLLAELPFRVARPFMAPPDIPADRADMLKKAFMDANRDGAYLEEAKRLQIDISPLPGEVVQSTFAEAAKLPAEIIERYKKILAGI